MRLDTQDKAALRHLDTGFKFNGDDTVATVAGEMEDQVVRADDDRYRLTVTFSSGEEFAILLSRQRTLEQLTIETDES